MRKHPERYRKTIDETAQWVFKVKEVYRYMKIPDHTINGVVEVVLMELNDEVSIPTLIHNLQ